MIDLEPAAQRATRVITSVADDQLDLPRPCPDACVGDLVDHIGVFAVRFTAAARKQSHASTSGPSTAQRRQPRARLARADLARSGGVGDGFNMWANTTAGGEGKPVERYVMQVPRRQAKTANQF